VVDNKTMQTVAIEIPRVPIVFAFVNPQSAVTTDSETIKQVAYVQERQGRLIGEITNARVCYRKGVTRPRSLPLFWTVFLTAPLAICRSAKVGLGVTLKNDRAILDGALHRFFVNA
jgi:hypothetical protein